MTLRVGIMLPRRETAMTGEHDAAGLIGFARAAEAAGFDSVGWGTRCWRVLEQSRCRRLPRWPLLAAAQAATVVLGTAGFKRWIGRAAAGEPT
jgi:hypothetical protein